MNKAAMIAEISDILRVPYLKSMYRMSVSDVKIIWREITAVASSIGDNYCSSSNKRYPSCDAPIGRYCRKHGVIHRES